MTQALNPSLNQIVLWLLTYKYWILFPIALLEGPIITIIAGFLSSQKALSLPVAYLVVIAGDIVGDAFYYGIGRWGGHPFIKKWGKFFGLNETHLAATESHFEKHAGKTLVFGKTQPYGGVILVAAGVSKMPFTKFMVWNFFPTLAKSLILILIGYYFGQAYEKISHYFNLTGIILTIIAVLLIIFYLVYKKRSK